MAHQINGFTEFVFRFFIINLIVASWISILRANSTPTSDSLEPTNDPPLLDCSEYAWNANSKNETLQRISFAARLHECFEANPYDITQFPMPLVNENLELERQRRQQRTPTLEIEYQFGVIYVIAFDHGEISLLGGTSLNWTDGYRAWNKSQIPIDYVKLPLGELWYPQLLFVSTISR